MKTGKILKSAVVAAGMIIGVALILISFYAYVIMPHSLSREDMEFYVKEAGDIPFYYCCVVFGLCMARYRLWRKGTGSPRFLKATVVLLLVTGLASMLAVGAFFDCILNSLSSIPSWSIWLESVAYYLPLCFLWVMFPRNRNRRGDVQ